jgi:hypothetical protein
MATKNKPRADHETSFCAREVHVRLRLVVEGEPSEDRLEELAFRALAVMEEHGADVALGPAVSCEFETHVIELDFDIEAHEASEIHQRISDAMGVLEREGGFRSRRSETVISPTSAA